MQLNPTYMIPLVLSSKKSRPATSSCSRSLFFFIIFCAPLTLLSIFRIARDSSLGLLIEYTGISSVVLTSSSGDRHLDLNCHDWFMLIVNIVQSGSLLLPLLLRKTSCKTWGKRGQLSGHIVTGPQVVHALAFGNTERRKYS